MTMTIPTSDIGEIFLRLANSLDNSVLPHIENHYGRLQVHAARELLLNLGTRIEFKSRDIEASESVLRETLASLEKLMGIAPNAGQETLRRAWTRSRNTLDCFTAIRYPTNGAKSV